jgi:hypothetical protein
MSTLAPILPKVCRLIRMLGSANDGEALGAARALDRTLRSEGSDFHDLARALESGDRGETKLGTGGADNARSCPTWFLLSRALKLAWLEIILDHSEPGGWTEGFALNVRERIASGAPLTTKQAACAQTLVAQSWQQGARP